MEIQRGDFVRITNENHEYYNRMFQVINYEKWYVDDDSQNIKERPRVRFDYILLLNKLQLIVVKDRNLIKEVDNYA